MNQMIESPTFSLTPQTMDEAMKMAEMMANSQMVPKDYVNKPGNVLVAVQMGAELGLKPVQSLQNIAVINGRPAIWGDGLRALVMSAPDLVSIDETIDDSIMTAKCVITRNVNGKQSVFTGVFSKEDATIAGIWGQNTWKKYPKRMLQWRAFGFAARDAYADRLKGIQLAEEVRDYKSEPTSPKDMGEAVVELPEYPDEKLDGMIAQWKDAIEAGKTNPDHIIAKISTKHQLTDAQLKIIKELA